MMPETRPATDADADFVYVLTEVCMREYVERTWGSWQEKETRARFNPATSQIIRSNGHDVGCIELVDEPSGLTLRKLYIAPEHQNLGIGSFFMRQAIEKAQADQKSISLRVLRTNPARRFYERHGFVVVETTQEHFYMEWKSGLPHSYRSA